MTIGETSEISRVRRWAILATMLSGTMLAILDSSILTVLVVPMMEEFKADLRTVEWVLTSYNLAFAVFLIGFGSLGDMAGRRRLYVWGQMVFVLGSGLAADRQRTVAAHRLPGDSGAWGGGLGAERLSAHPGSFSGGRAGGCSGDLGRCRWPGWGVRPYRWGYGGADLGMACPVSPEPPCRAVGHGGSLRTVGPRSAMAGSVL